MSDERLSKSSVLSVESKRAKSINLNDFVDDKSYVSLIETVYKSFQGNIETIKSVRYPKLYLLSFLDLTSSKFF